jgi:pyruvate dehydrogenase E2 component (dihydrolipoamide acetyltransferase)
MAYEFLLPDLGEGLKDAEIVNWLVSVGDTVLEDQAIAEVQTAKANVEIPSPVSGRVTRLGGEAGQVLEVGSVLIEFETEKRAPTSNSKEDHAQRSATTIALATNSDHAPNVRTHFLASPSTRQFALRNEMNLASVTGTGPRSRITMEDVREAINARDTKTIASATSTQQTQSLAPETISRRGAGPRADETLPLRGIRREVAKAMTRAWQEIPHVTEFREIDATQLLAAQQAIRNTLPEDAPRLTLLPLIVLATTCALARHPMMNATIDMDKDLITLKGEINIGIATSSDAGLVAPVLHNAGGKSLGQLRRDITDISTAVREGRITPSLIVGGTFTISNFGSYGTWLGTPIIRSPEVAILGTGRVQDRVVAVDGQAVVRPMLPLAISADHRLIDGHVMGAFMNELQALLENPIILFAEDF